MPSLAPEQPLHLSIKQLIATMPAPPVRCHDRDSNRVLSDDSWRVVVPGAEDSDSWAGQEIGQNPIVRLQELETTEYQNLMERR